MDEDTIDSRTTGVGRKRVLYEDATYDESMAMDSSEGETSNKRIKPSEDLDSHSPGEEPSFVEPDMRTNEQASAAIENSATPPITWNQGVQSGLRTSFAKKRNTRPMANSLTSGESEVRRGVQATTALPTDDVLMGEGGQPANLPPQIIHTPTPGLTPVDGEASDDDSRDEDYKPRPPPPNPSAPPEKKTYARIVGMMRTEITSRNIHVSKKKIQATARELSATPQANLEQAVQAAIDHLQGEQPDRPTSSATKIMPGVINGFQLRKTRRPKALYRSLGTIYDMRLISTTSHQDISPNDLSVHIFAPLFMLSNLDKVRNVKFTSAMISDAFAIYLEKCLQAEQQVKDRLRTIANDASVQALLQKMLGVVRQGKQSRAQSDLVAMWSSVLEIASTMEQGIADGIAGLEQPTNTGLDTLALLPRRPASAKSQEQLPSQKDKDFSENVASMPENIQNIANTGSVASKLSISGTLAIAPPSNGLLPVVEASVFTAPGNSRQAIIDKEEHQTAMEVDSSDALTSVSHVQESGAVSSDPLQSHTTDAEESMLMERYFPVPLGQPQVYLCLACAESGHRARDCPALTCYKCEARGHNTLSCPMNKRCGKCRGLGHSLEQCPEKLLISRAEAVPCDLCDSTNHIEIACPMIWRSFNPNFVQLKKVREIPIHCFSCGGSGHYGPECGLFKGPVLSDNRTWSKSNWKQYVDFNSKERAISAGIDYSFPAKKRHEFSIKGKANDPIDLEDSDDSEADFIRAKVNNVSQPKGQIRFGGYEDDRYLPREEISDRRSGNVPQYQTRPYPDNSSRYGRERTFSPPPQYGNGNQYGGSSQQRNNQQNDYYSITHGHGPPQGQPPPRGDLTLGRGGQYKGKAGVAKAEARAEAKAAKRQHKARQQAQQKSGEESRNPGNPSRVTKRSRATKRARAARGH